MASEPSKHRKNSILWDQKIISNVEKLRVKVWWKRAALGTVEKFRSLLQEQGESVPVGRQRAPEALQSLKTEAHFYNGKKMNLVTNLLNSYLVPNSQVNYSRLPPQAARSLVWFPSVISGKNAAPRHCAYALDFTSGRTRPDGGSASTAKIVTTALRHDKAPRCYQYEYFNSTIYTGHYIVLLNNRPKKHHPKPNKKITNTKPTGTAVVIRITTMKNLPEQQLSPPSCPFTMPMPVTQTSVPVSSLRIGLPSNSTDNSYYYKQKR